MKTMSVESLTTSSTANDVRKVSAFGLKSPPPSQHLKKILENYPEGSQIFKEALQNADDAHASHFCILLDERTHRTTSGCLDQFMGPSLVFCNDGVFSMEDWKSLQNMFESRKSSDCGSIGKFGMGSRCYFHMTVSGNHMAYLDPDWILTEIGGEFSELPVASLAEASTTTYVDQLANTLDGIFGFDSSSEYFHGTLFRLPLRMGRWARLSSFAPYEYSVPKTAKLLHKFKATAAQCLLFVHSVQTLSIWRWPESEDEPTLSYLTEIQPQLFENVPQGTHEFWDKRCVIRDYLQGQQSYGYDLKACLTQADTGTLPQIDDVYIIEERDCSEYTHEVSITKSRWLLNVCLVMSQDLLCYLDYTKVAPSVGVAVLLSPPIKSTAHLGKTDMFRFTKAKQDEMQQKTTFKELAGSNSIINMRQNNFSLTLKWALEHTAASTETKYSREGLAFCFLPLADVHTGLPVHIHGTFVLTDNRRSFWMALNDTEGQAQKWSEWNALLLKIALPELYVRVLLKVANQTTNHFKQLYNELHEGKLSDEEVRNAIVNLTDNYYDLWPDISEISVNFKPFLKEFSEQMKGEKLILKQPILYPTLDGTLDAHPMTCLHSKTADYQSPKRLKQFTNSVVPFRSTDCSFLSLNRVEQRVFENHLEVLFDAVSQCQILGYSLVWLPEHVVSIADDNSEKTTGRYSSDRALELSNNSPCQPPNTLKKKNKQSTELKKKIQVLEMYFNMLLPFWNSLSFENLIAIPQLPTLMLCLCKILGQGPDKYIEKFRPACSNLPFVLTHLPGVESDDSETRVRKSPMQCFDPLLAGFRVAQLAQPALQFRAPDVLRVLRSWGLKQRLGWTEIAQEAMSRVCVVGECQSASKYAYPVSEQVSSMTTF